jgi:hypothetical protein
MADAAAAVAGFPGRAIRASLTASGARTSCGVSAPAITRLGR